MTDRNAVLKWAERKTHVRKVDGVELTFREPSGLKWLELIDANKGDDARLTQVVDMLAETIVGKDGKPCFTREEIGDWSASRINSAGEAMNDAMGWTTDAEGNSEANRSDLRLTG